jgi:rhamnogalacturonan endolyase
MGPMMDDSTFFVAAPAAGAAGGRAGRGGGGGGAPAESDRASSLLSQAGDYIFFVHADANGHFAIPAVRPGTYTLYAWQDQGPICQSLAVDNITIKGDKTQDLGDVAWDPPYHPNLLFQIGKPDRMAGEYKLGNGPRAYDLLRQVPTTVNFTVGTSKEATDWYFAQNGGTWTVHFNVDRLPTGNCYLTIPLAGGGGNCALAVNGTSIGSIGKGDDSTLRRQANRAGVYARPAPIVFPASSLKHGENILTLQGSGIMYDTVVLEAD